MKKDGGLVEKKESEQAEARFTKQQMLASAKYKNRKELVSVLLDDGKTYTISEVDQMANRFMKGEVK